MELAETDRGLVPPTIESMREPRMSRRDAPEMGGIGHTFPWNQGNPHGLKPRPHTEAENTRTARTHVSTQLSGASNLTEELK